ncbi:hypothetical protein APHAL10511_005401 [Amanita phalloides]|nr:hypothetical protein APHAL10511_005401 [Amanita phalloides]
MREWEESDRLHGVGAPATAPRFHRGLVLASTTANVLAALHPANGSLAWRFLFDPQDNIIAFDSQTHRIAALSGSGPATLRTFDTLTGHILFEHRIHPGHALVSAAHAPADFILLSNGYRVSQIDGTTGKEKWSWTAPDESSLVVYTKLFSTSSAVYTIGLAKSFASYTLHVTALDSSTGRVLNDVHIPSNIAAAIPNACPTCAHWHGILLSLHVPHEYRPRMAWIEDGRIKSKALTPGLDGPVSTVKNHVFDRIVDVGLSDYGYFVALGKAEPPRVMKMEDDGTRVGPVAEFEKVSQSEASEMVFGGGVDEQGKPYLTRVFWSKVSRKAVVDLFSTTTTQTQRYTFAFDAPTHGSITHVTLTLSPNLQLLVSTSTGALQLWSISANDDGELVWNREEGLSTITASEFVELPEQPSLVSTGLQGEGFTRRLLRHLVEAQNLPHYLFHFIVRFATGPSSTTTTTITPSASVNTTAALVRDPFGFRQLIIAVTEFGKVYALDTTTGAVVWSRILGLGWAGEPGKNGKVVGGRVDVVKVFVIKPVGAGGVANPEVVLVAQRTAHNTLVDTVVFHVDAMTGKDVRTQVIKPAKDGRDRLEGLDVIQGPMLDAFLLQNETRALVMFDEFLQVYLYPENDETQAMFARLAPLLSFPLSESVNDKQGGKAKKRVVGHGVELNTHLSDRYIAYPTWTLSFPADERMTRLVPISKGPIASLGKVLGNRTTLYKYLNPRLLGVLTEPEPDVAVADLDASAMCGVYIVDGVKGSIVYRAALPGMPSMPGGAPICDVKMCMTENWLVYHYYDPESKGWRMVSVELYEGLADHKTGSADASSYDPAVRDVTVFEQAYVFPSAVTAMRTTETRYGMTSKEVVVATDDGKVRVLSRRELDPRRPKRKPTAEEEQDEMLVEYDPVVGSDPRRVVSHRYGVARIREVVTARAQLESTSLVFAYGLDLFLTRAVVAPSGAFDVLSEGFNKLQLVLTVMGLGMAIVVTGPMVRRKALRRGWYP